MKKIAFLILGFGLIFNSRAKNPTGDPNNPPKQISDYVTEVERIRFEENKGQILQLWDKQPAKFVKFSTSRMGSTVFLTENGWSQQFELFENPQSEEANNPNFGVAQSPLAENSKKNSILKTHRVDFTFVGCNTNPEIIKLGESEDYINYYNRNVLDVHYYSQIIYKDIYPNIDWIVYSNEKGMKYDFRVNPGGDPSQIRIKISDHNGAKIDSEGNLSIETSLGNITEEKPLSFTNPENIVPSQYVWNGDVLSFKIGEYDENQALTIDPVRLWATYYGSYRNNTFYSGFSGRNRINGSAIDTDNNLILVGSTMSTVGIATTGSHFSTFDAYDERTGMIIKFNGSGTRLWATYYGDTASLTTDLITELNDVAVDKNKNIYVTGYTQAANCIGTTGTAYPNKSNTTNGDFDACLIKFDPSGVRQWGTYKGGDDADYGFAVAVDDKNSFVYIAGSTYSSTKITLFGCGTWQCSKTAPTNANLDGFISKFKMSDGTHASNSNTYFGDADKDELYDIKVDANGNVYVVGVTHSFTTPNVTTNSGTKLYSKSAHQTFYGGSGDGVIAKFNTSLDRVWSTYYGASKLDNTITLALDDSANVYVSGNTFSDSFISNTSSTKYPGLGANSDIYITKFSTSGVRQWGRYFGGEYTDEVLDIAYKKSHGLTFTGFSVGSAFATKDAYASKAENDYDAFWATLHPQKATVEYASYYPGRGIDAFQTVSIDSNNNVYLAGYTTDSSGWASMFSHQKQGANTSTYVHAEFASGIIAKFGDGTVDWRGTGNYTATSNWSNSTGPKTSDIVRVLSGELTLNTYDTINELYIHNGATVKLGSNFVIGTLRLKNGTIDLNNYKLTILGRVVSNNDSAKYYIAAGTAVNPKPYSKLEFDPYARGTYSNLYFDPNANTIFQLILGNDNGDKKGADVYVYNDLKIKGGQDGSGNIGMGYISINLNSYLRNPNGTLWLKSDTLNSYVRFVGDNFNYNSATYKLFAYVKIEQEYFGARGWRMMAHPYRSAITLQDIADDIELIGSGGTAEGFYSDTDTNSAAYYFDYASADSSKTTDPGWKPFKTAKGSTKFSFAERAWQVQSPIMLFNPGAQRGTGAFSNPANATYKAGKIIYANSNGGSQLNDGRTRSITITSAPNGNVFITNPYTAPVKINSMGLTSSNVQPYFYYWKQRRNAITNNFMPAQWQAELFNTGNSTRDSHISIPPFGTIMVKMKNSTLSTSVRESSKQTSNYSYIIGSSYGASSQNQLFATLGEPMLGPDALEIKLLVNDSAEVDRMVIYDRDSQSLNYNEFDAPKYQDPQFPNIFALTADGKKVELDGINITHLLNSGSNYIEIPLVISRDAAKAFKTLSMSIGEKSTELDAYFKDATTQTLTPANSFDKLSIKFNESESTINRYSIVFKRKTASLEDQTTKQNRNTLVYPNPGSESVTIRLVGNFGKQNYCITNSTGTIIQKGTLQDFTTINVRDWKNGIYFIQVNGNTTKFIKMSN